MEFLQMDTPQLNIFEETKMSKTKILFMGRKQVGAQSLAHLASRGDVEIVGVLTDSHLSVSPTSDIAQKYGFPLFQFDDALAALQSGSLKFDLGISMLYWRKLKNEFLTTPARGVINFHPAPLPSFKGTAGYNLAILESHSTWATTAHYVDESIDTGEIIEVSTFPIAREHETAKSLEALSQGKLLAQFKRVASQAIDSAQRLPSTPNVGGRYISRTEMETMKEIKPGDDVSRKIRAFWFPPYDGAYLMVNGVKCTLVDRYILEQLADPGNSTLFTPESAS